VEDETDLREMIVRGLERAGYRVLQASDGEQAVETATKFEQRIDLLISDVVMSGIRGTQVAQKLSQIFPCIKVLYMSGYTENAMFHQNLLKAGVAFIQKPFTLESLEDKVAQMLESKATYAASTS
jgi:DNA-binding NtrC family response regulator